uniref:F169A protein n=1 Tax=Otus sunia TaxID=257818 RepID=A0A8C8AXX0_9STRI
QTHKVLALFAPEDSLTAVALYLADQWWSIDDIVRTSVPSREGLQQVKFVGERVVLYVLNRIIYRKQEIERNEVPFLCHGGNDYAKIMWKKGEAIGFYSVKPTACKHYFEKYPGDHDLLWEVEGAGHWFQRTPITTVLQREKLKIAGMDALFCFLTLCKSCTVECLFNSDFCERCSWKLAERFLFETPSEPLNSEVAEEIGKTSLMAEEETTNEVLGGESKLQSESQEEPLTLFVPLILESPAKPSEDTASEVLNVNDSEVLTEESTSVEEGIEEHRQESEKKSTSTENAAASRPKEEPSDNGLPNSIVIESAEESVSENVLPKPASSVEDQNDEAGHNSQEGPVALSRSSLIMVELEGVSFQQSSGQEVQKNQLEEHSEESAEKMDQYMQTLSERAADSSSEEAEIEVPIVDRRNLRRKAKGYKGPSKKKGKPA